MCPQFSYLQRFVERHRVQEDRGEIFRLYAPQDLRSMRRADLVYLLDELGVSMSPCWTKQDAINTIKMLLPGDAFDELAVLCQKPTAWLARAVLRKGLQGNLRPKGRFAYDRWDYLRAIADDISRKEDGRDPNERRVGFGRHSLRTWADLLQKPDFCDYVLCVYDNDETMETERFCKLAFWLTLYRAREDAAEIYRQRLPASLPSLSELIFGAQMLVSQYHWDQGPTVDKHESDDAIMGGRRRRRSPQPLNKDVIEYLRLLPLDSQDPGRQRL